MVIILNHLREEQVKAKAWQLLIRLFKEAKRDSMIDFDEGRILSSANLNITKLLEYLRVAWADKRIDHNERKNIEFLVQKIENDAISLAEYDEIITQQEEALLEIIREMISKFADDNYY